MIGLEASGPAGKPSGTFEPPWCFVEGFRNGRSPQLCEAGIVALFSRLRQSFAATKESYEAGAAKAACLLLAGAFALAAVVVWFVQLFGPITACLFFSGAFILIGLSVGSVSRAKEKEASASLESAKRGVTQNVHAITNAVQSAASEAREHVSPLPVLILTALLLSLFYFSGSRQSSVT